MKHINYPSIGQFRNCIKSITDFTRYAGKDESGEPIYDGGRPLPVIEMTGTVKLHGTNAGVAYNKVDGLWAQSRENIITIEKDNMGFAAFVEKNKEEFTIIHSRCRLLNDVPDNVTTVLFGEWAGKGIQKGVAISNIDKSFFIFGMAIDYDTPVWVNINEITFYPNNRIYKINTYPSFTATVDFGNPQAAQNTLVAITEQVEKECPVGKAFGHSGVGEGVVWGFTYNGRYFNFKVKGEEHSISKVKVLAAVDTEKLESVNAFVEYAVTQNRVDQIMQKVFGSKENFDVKKTGEFVKAMAADIIKEETDTLVNNGLCWKDVCNQVNYKAKQMMFKGVI